jgi:TolB-like protein/Tfp pilus assembly protein PilF
MAAEPIRIGALTLVPGRELVGAGGGGVAIGGRALDILSALAEARGALVTKNELLGAVWAGAIVEDNALQAQISAARKALGGEARRLVTVHGRGYRLDLDAVQTAAIPATPASSIAVLPFDNLSGKQDHAYLADGLAEELITTLARVPGLKVPARVSSFAYRGKAADVRAIAAELGVATVLEGSVRAGGGRLRVTAQLIDAATGFHLWAQSFDRTMTDLLTLQDDLAEAIASALRRELGPRLRATHSAEAMRLVLEARREARSLRPEGLQAAARLAREALALDPDFAKAWESLAGTTFVMSTWGFGPRDLAREASAHARRALELDPSLSGALAILGGVESSAGRFVEAVDLLERALALDPDDAVVAEHAALAAFLPTGLRTRAVALTERSVKLAPRRAITLLVRATCAGQAGDAAGMKRYFDDALRLGQTTSRFLVELVQAEIAFAQGDAQGALAAVAPLFERELGMPDAVEDLRGIFASIFDGANRTFAIDRTMALFRDADGSGRLWGQTGSAALFLHWAVRLGDLDAAFVVARRVVDHWRETGRLAIGTLPRLWPPYMAPFRRDPRFQELVRDLDLIRFYRRYGPPDGHRLEGDTLVVLS